MTEDAPNIGADAPAVLEGALADRSAWDAVNCPIAAALGVIGTRSAMLILRQAYYGTRRFDAFAERVGITETVAATRLRELTEAGLLRREPYREPGQRTRHEYHLTTMGRDLLPVVIGLFDWGDKYLTRGRGAPLELRHHDCGEPVHAMVRCGAGHDVALGEIGVRARRRRPRA